ncbi:MAG: putative Ig domain-containing protein [Planctomycetes bacterium]|nr:putative Ig domain-containing protein [Planctomycetota bacterium]MCB9936277.1 putative Ig domain-containing protein [Planctomycetota bacterium]
MRKLATALFLTILMLAGCDSGGGSGGGGGGGGPATQAAYDIQVSGPPASGLQVNRAFDVTLNFVAAGTANPINVISSETISASVLSGPGALVGAVTSQGNGTSSLLFSGLGLNQPGTYVLQFSGPNAATPGQTISFVVGPQRNLRFSAVPASAAINNPFSVTVETYDPATGLAAAPGSTVAITISLNTGTGNLGGTLTGNLTSGSSLQFNNLTYDTLEQITLRASAFVFPDAISGPINITNVNFINSPGPFIALKSVRVNDPYSDSVAFAAPNTVTGFAVNTGSSLPAGLSLNTSNGAITGTPTTAGSYEFELYAVLPGGNAQALRCALAVFSSGETEVVNGQNFTAAGPHTANGPVTETYSFTSSYDSIGYPQASTFNCRIQYYYPNFATAPSPAPVLLHHRGRGFNMMDYDLLGAHLASYGIIFVTIEDYQSFYDGGGSGQSPNTTYDSVAERGHESASAFQEGVQQWVLAKNAQSGHPLQNRVDEKKIFMSGHSRGGGATHSSHVRSQPYMFNGTQRQNINIRGTIYFMAFDMRFFTSTVSGSSVVYPVPTPQPRLPSLIIAAENDGDLIYPICDQLIDRATGPTTFATIYGGCHNYLGDANAVEFGASPYITRQQQMDRMFNLVIAFIKRWGNLDRSLDGLLYNNEKAGSSEVGITAWRNMAERVMLDDHQGGNKAVNSLGGANTLSSGTWSTSASIYPPTGYGDNYASLNLRHNIVTLSPSVTSTYGSNIPSASQDLSRTRRFMFRIGSVDYNAEALKGFDWVTVRVRLTDAQNDTATVTLFDRTSPANTYLPDYPGSGSNVYDRFVEANVLLSAFTAANANLTLSQLNKVELIFETGTFSSVSSRQLYFDDLRFE